MISSIAAENFWYVLEQTGTAIWRRSLLGANDAPAGGLVDILGLQIDYAPAALLSVLDQSDRTQIEAVKTQLVACAADGGEFSTELAIRLQDGTLSRVAIGGRVFGDVDHEPPYWAGFVRNVTGQRQVEEEMLRRKATLTAILDNGLDIVSLSSADGVIHYVSPLVTTILGYTPDEIRNTPLAAIVHPEDYPALEGGLLELWSLPGESRRFEYRVRHRNGDYRWFENKVSNYLDHPWLQVVVSVGHDITLRRKALLALGEMEERFRQLAENTAELFWTYDADTRRIVYANPAFRTIWGYQNGDPYGAVDQRLDAVYEADRAVYLAALARQLAGEQTSVEYRIVKRDDTVKWIWDRSFPVVGVDGKVRWVAGLATDVTERRRAEIEARRLNDQLEERVLARTTELELEIAERKLTEAELQMQRDFMRQITDSMGQGLIVYDKFGIVEYCNPYLANLFGYRPEELVGQPMGRFLVAGDEAILRNNMLRRAAGEASSYEIRIQARNGAVRYLLIAATPRHRLGVLDGGIAVLTDLTERRQVEEMVRQREEELRLLADNTTDIIARYSMQRRLVSITPAVKTVLEYDPDELIRGLAWLNIHPDDRTKYEQVFALPVDGSDTTRTELRVKHLAGHYVWLETISKLVRDPETRNPIGIVLSSRDISTRKRAEESLLHRSQEIVVANLELARASKLKDEFLANMSHELRTPLTGILGLTEGLSGGVYGVMNERQERTLRLIDESGRHLLNLINDILDLSKVEAGKIDLRSEPLAVMDVCRASVRMVRQLAIKKQQEIELRVEPEDLRMKADVQRVKQILVNLLSNAVKFTPAGGRVGLEVSMDTEKQRVRFVVWDTGIGIPADRQTALFQPFMQLDAGLGRQYGGTGLGLALVRRLTELHGGTVQVESKPGAGSRFIVTLPSQLGAPLSPPAFAGQRPASGTESRFARTPSVLLVEDAINSTSSIGSYLHAAGILVAVAAQPPEIVTKARRMGPDVILIDMQMSGHDGIETIHRIRHDNDPMVARTPIVAMIAISVAGDRERCLGAGASDTIGKPVDLAHLMRVVRQYLP
ncbi:MAG: PAS domain S-box protein [Anaerolineales bacterium]|nr:PAS domain S-box protein [Anaerolineales bacterium]